MKKLIELINSINPEGFPFLWINGLFFEFRKNQWELTYCKQ